jgi:heat shock protein HtpX
MNNTIKTILFFSVFVVILIGIGRYVGGMRGMYVMAIIGIIMNLGMYYFSDKIALFSAKAKPIDEKNSPKIVSMVKELTQNAKLPMPKLYISDNPSPNAFATGRNPDHSAVVLTKGLIANLDEEEVRGVIAHELAHIKNRDILISTIAAVMASIITTAAYHLRWINIFGGSDNNRNIIADLAIMILAPIAATLVQLAISRQREYKADRTGAEFAKNPNGLANALEKIDAYSSNKSLPTANVNPAFENLYISNPLGGGKKGLSLIGRLFSTHPPIPERVEKLRQM